MANTFIGKLGAARVYESTETLRSLASGNVEKFVSPATFSDQTSNARADDAANMAAILEGAGDYCYVGNTSKFCRLKVDVDTAAVGSGALTVSYYNGSTWVAISTVTDGTASGGDTLAVDGYIYWLTPVDWAVQGDASLDSDKYYVRLSCASNPGTDPVLDQLWPVDGLYYEFAFEQMDLNAPEARARPEEVAVLDRGTFNSNTHYVQGLDDPTMEPVEITFSCKLQDELASGSLALKQAISCLNPAVATWNATGTSTKTDTKLLSSDGTMVQTPAFADTAAGKKTVALQVVWTSLGGLKVGRAYNECWFDLSKQKIAEGADGLTVSLTAVCYGSIEEIGDFSYPY